MDTDRRTDDNPPSSAVLAAAGRPATVLRLSGHLDLDATRRLGRRLFELVRTTPVIQLDLSEVDRLERPGLALLISCRRLSHAYGGRLQLVATSPEVDRAVRDAGLDRVFRSA